MSEQFIHSEEHLIAADISKYCGEPKKFNRYLGIILRIGKRKAYLIFSELKQREAEYLHKPPEERPPPIGVNTSHQRKSSSFASFGSMSPLQTLRRC